MIVPALMEGISHCTSCRLLDKYCCTGNMQDAHLQVGHCCGPNVHLAVVVLSATGTGGSLQHALATDVAQIILAQMALNYKHGYRACEAARVMHVSS